MKDLLTILILAVLVFFAWGIAKLQKQSYEGLWAILYIPLIIMMMMYGEMIYNTYFLK